MSWPKRAGQNHFSCPQLYADPTTVMGYFLAATPSSITGNLGWVLEVDIRVYDRNPFVSGITTLSRKPAGPEYVELNSGDKDSTQSRTDVDRLTLALRDIALRSVEKNPGPDLGLGCNHNLSGSLFVRDKDTSGIIIGRASLLGQSQDHPTFGSRIKWAVRLFGDIIGWSSHLPVPAVLCIT